MDIAVGSRYADECDAASFDGAAEEQYRRIIRERADERAHADTSDRDEDCGLLTHLAAHPSGRDGEEHAAYRQ